MTEQNTHRAEFGERRATRAVIRHAFLDEKLREPQVLQRIVQENQLAVIVVYTLDLFQLVHDAREVRPGFGKQRRKRRGLVFGRGHAVGYLRDGGGPQAVREHIMQSADFAPQPPLGPLGQRPGNHVERLDRARGLSDQRVIRRHGARLQRVGL